MRRRVNITAPKQTAPQRLNKCSAFGGQFANVGRVGVGLSSPPTEGNNSPITQRGITFL